MEQFLPNKKREKNEQNVFKIKNSAQQGIPLWTEKKANTRNTFRVQLMRGNSSDSKEKKRGNRVLNFKLAFLWSVKRLFPQELMAKNVKVFPIAIKKNVWRVMNE